MPSIMMMHRITGAAPHQQHLRQPTVFGARGRMVGVDATAGQQVRQGATNRCRCSAAPEGAVMTGFSRGDRSRTKSRRSGITSANSGRISRRPHHEVPQMARRYASVTPSWRSRRRTSARYSGTITAVTNWAASVNVQIANLNAQLVAFSGLHGAAATFPIDTNKPARRRMKYSTTFDAGISVPTTWSRGVFGQLGLIIRASLIGTTAGHCREGRSSSHHEAHEVGGAYPAPRRLPDISTKTRVLNVCMSNGILSICRLEPRKQVNKAAGTEEPPRRAAVTAATKYGRRSPNRKSLQLLEGGPRRPARSSSPASVGAICSPSYDRFRREDKAIINIFSPKLRS